MSKAKQRQGELAAWAATRHRQTYLRYIGFALLGVEFGIVIGLLVADNPETLISIGGVLLLAAYFLGLLMVDR